MVKTQTDGEDNQYTDHLCPWIKMMHPGGFVEVEKNIHDQLINAKLDMGNQSIVK